MTDQQITVEQLKHHVLDLLHGICPAECLGDVDLSLPNFESKVMAFVAQQRADAVREIAADLTAIQKAHDEQKTRIYAELADARKEVSSLRYALMDCGNAVGAAVSENCTTDFLLKIPGEVTAVFMRLRADSAAFEKAEYERNEACTELAAAKSELELQSKAYGLLVVQLDAAKAQLAEAEKDAERYRWLRDQHKKHLGLTICKVGMWDLTPWSGDDPDSAIDAARTAQAGEKQG